MLDLRPKLPATAPDAHRPAAHALHPRCVPQVRKNGVCGWLRPDGKTQVTVEYKKEGGAVVPIRVHTILISTQHNRGARAGQAGAGGLPWGLHVVPGARAGGHSVHWRAPPCLLGALPPAHCPHPSTYPPACQM